MATPKTETVRNIEIWKALHTRNTPHLFSGAPVDDSILVFIWFLVFLIILILLIFFSDKERIKRRLKKAQKLSIQEFPEGAIGKIVGQITSIKEPLVSPLSLRQCVHYHVVVKEPRTDSRGRSTLSTIIDEEYSQDFILDDGTGKARVRMITGERILAPGPGRVFKRLPDPEVYVHKDRHFSSGTFNNAKEQLERLLANHERSSTNFLGFNKSIRYEEGILEAGEEVAVYGVGRWVDDPDVEDLPDGQSQLLIIESSLETRLSISDDFDADES